MTCRVLSAVGSLGAAALLDDTLGPDGPFEAFLALPFPLLRFWGLPFLVLGVAALEAPDFLAAILSEVLEALAVEVEAMLSPDRV